VLLLGLDRHRPTGRGFEPEAHHRLVDRADLLHVECAIGDALTVKDEELLERAVDGAVGHERRLDPLVDLARPGGRAALDEGEASGIEEHAVALGKPHRARLGAVVDHAEEDDELRPRAVALVHRVGEQRGVLAQALVEARERVVAQERLVLGQHAPLLGIEQKDEPQDDGEQRAVDLVRMLGERLA
jgi:hypothetical protein